MLHKGGSVVRKNLNFKNQGIFLCVKKFPRMHYTTR